jgi:hypothetical protein
MWKERDDEEGGKGGREEVTAVAQWAKAPGIHCYFAGSILTVNRQTQIPTVLMK